MESSRMGNVTVLQDKVVDLVKLYFKGHYVAEDVMDMLADTLIDDGYVTAANLGIGSPSDMTISGVIEGKDIEE